MNLIKKNPNQSELSPTDVYQQLQLSLFKILNFLPNKNTDISFRISSLDSFLFQPSWGYCLDVLNRIEEILRKENYRYKGGMCSHIRNKKLALCSPNFGISVFIFLVLTVKNKSYRPTRIGMMHAVCIFV